MKKAGKRGITFLLIALLVLQAALPMAYAEESYLSAEEAAEETLEAQTEVLTVAEAIARNSGIATVQGYIVGYAISADNIGTDPAGNNAQYNLVLKDDPADDYHMIVQLPAGAVRDNWSIRNHPEVIGQLVQATGSLEDYFSIPGMKNTTAIVSVDEAEPPAEQVTLTYDPAGAAQTDPSIPLSYSYDKDSSIELATPEALGLNYPGRTFSGWQVAGSETVLAAGSTFVVSADTTLIAQWLEGSVPGEDEVLISFDTSSYNGEVFEPVILARGSSFNTSRIAMPYPANTADQYFKHWYRLGVDGEEIYTNPATRFQSDSVLYPKYLDKKPIRFHTNVVLNRSLPLVYDLYHADGRLVQAGIGTGYDNPYVELEEGSYYLTIARDQLTHEGVYYGELFSYTRDNYDLPLLPTQTQNGDLSQGSFDDEGNFRLDFIIQAGPNNTSDTRAYHRALAWLDFDPALAQHRLIYAAGGGAFAEGALTEILVDEGETVVLSTPEDLGLTRDGHDFIGWLLEGTTETYQPGSAFVVDQPVRFIAQWQASEPVIGEDEVLISFDTSGYTEEVLSPVVLRKGYSFNTDRKEMPYPANTESEYFEYWYKLVDGEAVYVNQATRFDESLTLYPKYTAKKDIRFHLSTTLSNRATPILYDIYTIGGEPVYQDLASGSDPQAVVLAEGDYYLTISQEQLTQNGITYDTFVSYTRDNYDQPLKPTKTSLGDLDRGSFDDSGNFRLDFVIQAGAGNTTATQTYHRALAWLGFEAANTRRITVTPKSHDFQTERLIRETIEISYSDTQTTIQNYPGSVVTIIPDGDFHVTFSNLPEGLKAEAYIGSKRLVEGDLYGTDDVTITLYVRPEDAPDFPDDLSGYTIATLQTRLSPLSEGVTIKLYSGDAELVPTQNNPNTYQHLIDQRDYTVTLEDLPEHLMIGSASLGSTELVLTELSRNSFSFTPVFSSAYSQVLTIHLVERTAYTVSFEAGGGTFGEGAETSLNVYDGDTISLPYAFTLGLQKDGQVFSGWLLEAMSELYQPNDTYTVDSDVTFVAQWEDVRGQLILFVVDEDLTDKLPEPYLIDDQGREISLTSDSYTDRERWWQTDREALLNGSYRLKFRGLGDGQTVDLENAAPSLSSTVVITQTELGEYVLTFDFDETKSAASRFVKLRATINKPSDVTLTFDPNGGYFKDETKSSMTLRAGTEVVLPHGDEIELYYQKGMVFDRWLLEGDGPKVYFEAGDTITLEEDTTLIAQWRRPGKGNSRDKPGKGNQKPHPGQGVGPNGMIR